jgi:hypothetical protein
MPANGRYLLLAEFKPHTEEHHYRLDSMVERVCSIVNIISVILLPLAFLVLAPLFTLLVYVGLADVVQQTYNRKTIKRKLGISDIGVIGRFKVEILKQKDAES